MTNKYMYFIANWKMFGGLNTLNSVHKVISFLKKFKKKKFVKIIYCPPNTLIRPMSKKLENTKIDVGAQNCHENHTYGAFTGSVNSKMLKNVGAKYVIIGHSENRSRGENNKLINAKVKSALKFGLKVIFCIGETRQQKRKNLTKQILNRQIKEGLSKIKNKKNIIFAYEPVWSIGTGLIPKSTDLHETISYIKNQNRSIKVLYGGSVNSKNILGLNTVNNIDGYLIGGASQDPKKFIDIIKKTYN
ncbi:triose-phosphate isomerase [Candidatus Pelagibacter sp.]|nr:triose-phosphate isomerase [Candidatus Pelagibacter sp.]